MADDALHDYKMQFAALLIRVPKNQRYQVAASIARQVVGKERAEQYPAYICQIAEEWPFDSEVVAEMDRLELIVKPKEVILNELWTRATSRDVETKDQLSAFRLYCEAIGLVGKGSKDDGKPNESLNKLQELLVASTNKS